MSNPFADKRVPVTLYQVPREDNQSFMNNMLGEYVSFDKLIPTVVVRLEGSDEEIQEKSFRVFNSDELNFTLNYSMSVGDVLDIAGRRYRCIPFGWESL